MWITSYLDPSQKIPTLLESVGSVPLYPCGSAEGMANRMGGVGDGDTPESSYKHGRISDRMVGIIHRIR
jgi:hypothetical protein